MWLKALFLFQNVLVFEGNNSYVCWKNEDILDYFYKCKDMAILSLHMVKNVIKGSFPISKVLVFEVNSYVCWKNEDIRLFYDCTW